MIDEVEGRRKALAFANALKAPAYGCGPSVDSDALVASPDGFAFVSMHDGQVGPKAGFRLCRRSLSHVKRCLRRKDDEIIGERQGWDFERDDFEPKYPDAVAMVMAGCRPDINYYRLTLGPFNILTLLHGRRNRRFQVIGATLFYSEDGAELQRRWDTHIADALAHLERRWDWLDTKELEQILADEFDYEPDDE